MKYLCLIYNDENRIASFPEAELKGLMGEYYALMDDVRTSGRLLGAERLQPTRTATTIRSRNGKVTTTDGPFAETKEQLGGFFLIEARDLNDAIQVASRIPATRTGSVEVRPIWELNAQ